MNSHFMNDSMNWRKLCRAAAIEQDAEKVSQLVRRINSTLAIRQRTLRRFAKTMHHRVSRAAATMDHAA